MVGDVAATVAANDGDALGFELRFVPDQVLVGTFAHTDGIDGRVLGEYECVGRVASAS